MKVNFCWFSYERDGSILPYSVGSVLKNFPDAKCFIYEDGLRPIGEPFRTQLLEQGARIRKTWFLRKGNLNGIECLRGMLGAMKEASEGVDWVGKIDSDNIIHRSDYIKKLLEENKERFQVGFAKKNAVFCWGWLYFISPTILTKLLLELNRSGRMFYDPTGKFAEDYTLSSLIRHTTNYNEAIYVESFKEFHERLLFWDYSSTLEQVTEKTNLINFGAPNIRQDSDFLNLRADLMKRAYERC